MSSFSTDKSKGRKPIPRFVAEQYEGGARGFKATKRRHLKALIKAYEELRCGCAHLPGFPHHMSMIAKGIAMLSEELAEKKWGR
jgi:hypothetical protein